MGTATARRLHLLMHIVATAARLALHPFRMQHFKSHHASVCEVVVVLQHEDGASSGSSGDGLGQATINVLLEFVYGELPEAPPPPAERAR